jgi:dimethylargininase
LKITHAITRLPGSDFAQGITTADLGSPDYDLMLRQHQAYVQTLKSLDIRVVTLEPLLGYPDAYFVEDVAVILPEAAVITRPGAASRRDEIKSIEPALSPFRPLVRIEEPGTLDGGDILVADDHWFIGISERTNQNGAEQLGHILNEYGFQWTAVQVQAGLHLKSSLNYVGKKTMLVSQPFADHEALRNYRLIVIDQTEEYACNTLWVNDHLITPAGFPKVHAQLETLGYPIIELDVSECQKMDGGLTCMSLRLSVNTG